MNNARRKYRAQSVLEYTMVIACLVGALLAMQIYIKRSIQGRARDAADEIGEQYSAKTTTSMLIQGVSTPDGQNVTTTGKPRFIDVKRSDGTTETREIMEVTRTEPVNTTINPGNYEQTGALSDEKLSD